MKVTTPAGNGDAIEKTIVIVVRLETPSKKYKDRMITGNDNTGLYWFYESEVKELFT